MMRKLPIGIQDFASLREGGYLYVDKTRFIHKLASEGKVYFLSRPRRFGKSLLMSAMDAYFSGKRKLFRGLEIEKLEEERPADPSGTAWLQGPVIHLDFNSVSCDSAEHLQRSIGSMLKRFEKRWGLEDEDELNADRFYNLIQKMHDDTGRKVTVLVDEYDKPLINTMHDEPLNDQLRDELKAFYSVLKTADGYLRFVLLTGVTKFSHVSIFSDLNQLKDISLIEDYNEICGLTEQEIRHTFGPELDAFGDASHLGSGEVLREMSRWYDGYLFARHGTGIFNPYSVLNALDRKEFGNYWFTTGTPTFLINMLRKVNFTIPDMADGIVAKQEAFTAYRSSMNEPLPLFYQSGYLTIKGYDPEYQRYTLGFPNYEVRYSFLNWLLPEYFKDASGDTGMTADEFADAVRTGDIDRFMSKLKSLLASVAYDDSSAADKTASYEHTYRTAVYLIFTLCGQDLRPEVHMSKGRSDAVLQLKDKVYIFEFKMKENGDAEDALRQIDRQQYALAYAASAKRIIKIGVVFDPDERNIVDYKIE